jgi:hypothetical protein
LRAAAKANLAEAMWRAVQGELVPIEFLSQRMEFDAGGNVSFMP